jgi:D-tagatose-1,6-bisphosphate aldolase subunit GatZ/KbaZ
MVGYPVLIESTSNQVNQYGGYSGMTPSQFSRFILDLCQKYNFQEHRLLMGGDHLGPFPWRDLPATIAMQKASEMVKDYVKAGYRKIHLDPSMHCGDDDPTKPLNMRLIAERAATLCLVAEQAVADGPEPEYKPIYVIGSEVPSPGGLRVFEEELTVTTVSNVEETIQFTREGFLERGLESAWDRVIAIVVQAGADFGDQTIHSYDRSKTTDLRQLIERENRFVFEAHSTDYQTLNSLKKMIKDHFAILKVGPELTFAYREAIFALEQIEQQIAASMPGMEPSDVSDVVDRIMRNDPKYWEKYYVGTEAEITLARKFSISDRIRYYWSDAEVINAVRRLFENLVSVQIPFSLLRQYLPAQHQKIRDGLLPRSPQACVEDHICRVLDKYAHAVGNID